MSDDQTFADWERGERRRARVTAFLAASVGLLAVAVLTLITEVHQRDETRQVLCNQVILARALLESVPEERPVFASLVEVAQSHDDCGGQ